MREQQDVKPIAIAICGESGAGKTTTTGIIQGLGFRPCSVSGLLRQEAENALESPSRSQVQNYGKEKQVAEGPDYFARRLLSEINPFAYPRTVIDGLRNLAELETLRAGARDAGAHFVLLAMMTPDETRFERVQSRGRGGDPLSLAEFQQDDARAAGLEGGDQAFQQNIALINAADVRITNEGSMEDLELHIKDLLNRLEQA
ncbi:MAG: hypothetical protein WED11_01890 [Natronospirillum sp.]